MRRSQALGLSGLLHFGIFWVLLWGFAQSEAVKFERKWLQPLTITVLEAAPKSRNPQKRVSNLPKQGRSTKSNMASKNSNLQRFIPSITEKLLIGSPSGVGSVSQLKKFGEDSGNLEKLQDFSFYNHVWTLLDERLKYPGILVERKIDGIVNASLLLQSDGSIDWSSLRLEGGNKYLRFYVLRVLREAFLVPIEVQRFSQVQLPHQLDLIFEFKITEQPVQEAEVGRSFSMGQMMAFYRGGQRSNLEWKLGPIRGIFPIPAASLDVLGFADEIINGDPLLRFLKGE